MFASMMSVHPKGGCSVWDTKVSLTSVDMVSGLYKCCWILPFFTICRGSLQVLTTLFSAFVVLHVRLGGSEGYKMLSWLDSHIF